MTDITATNQTNLSEVSGATVPVAVPDEDARPKWRHRKGDRYMPVFAPWLGSPETGYWTEWHSLDEFHPTLAGARRAGFQSQDSDDFNIAVVRDRKLVAILWMDDDMQEPQDVLDALWPTVEGYL